MSLAVDEVKPSPLRLTPTDVGRQLLIVQQDSNSRKFTPIGVLTIEQVNQFRFEYLPGRSPSPGIAMFPDPGKPYTVTGLPAFLATRVMDPKQPAFDEYVRAFALSVPVSPIELLVRSSGSRVTDTYHVVELLRPDEQGHARQHLLVNGVRYIPDQGLIDNLDPGQRLRVVADPDNPVNPAALQLWSDEGQIGWVADWLLETLRAVEEAAGSYEFHVQQVNPPDVGFHQRVLISLDIHVPPGTDLYGHWRGHATAV